MELRPIPNHLGYFAGDDGFIYSNCSRGNQKINSNKLRKLKQNIQSTGKYYIVSVKNNDGKRYTQRVHKLVCITYHGYPLNEKYTVSHINGDWKNNKPINLKWETYSENHQRKKEHGTDDIGIKNSRAKIDLNTLKEIRRLLTEKKLTHKEIGERFNLSRLFITKIANGHRYKGQGL